MEGIRGGRGGENTGKRTRLGEEGLGQHSPRKRNRDASLTIKSLLCIVQHFTQGFILWWFHMPCAGSCAGPPCTRRNRLRGRALERLCTALKKGLCSAFALRDDLKIGKFNRSSNNGISGDCGCDFLNIA